MIRSYPFQALLALAGLGLLIGLPSLEYSKKPAILMSQTQASACFPHTSVTQNAHKPYYAVDAKSSLNSAPVADDALSNPQAIDGARLNARMRQSLRQCV